MLILAGVTIATLTGDNGILTRAQEAKEENEKAEIIEQIRLDISDKQIENQGSIDEDEFYEILERYGTISTDKTTLTTTKGNYDILISDIYDENLADNNIDYTINVSSSTVDLHWDKNILSFSKNDKTEKYNIVWIDEKEVDFSQIKSSGGFAGKFVLAGTEEKYFAINLQASSFLQSFTGDSQTNTVTGLNFSDKPALQGSPLARIKFVILDDGSVNIQYRANDGNGDWIDYYTLEKDIINNYVSGDTRFGFVITDVDGTFLGDTTSYAIYNDSYNNMDIFDKKVAFLGDSITTNLQYNYSELLRTWCGLAKYGYGLGGSPISGNTSNSYVDRFTKPGSEYYEEVDKDVDVIFIFGGHNDGQDNLGTIDDTTQDTFYGSIRILIEYFQDNYPNAKLIFATPIQRKDPTAYEGKKNKAEAMKNICKLYNVDCIDLYNNSGITKENADIYLGDGIHPNTEGHKLIAEYLYKIFRKIEV